MAHAKKEHLEGFQELLSEIRDIPGLKEKSHGCFYHKSKSVLHFHIEAHTGAKKGGPRLFAHVFDGTNWQEFDLIAPMSDKKQKLVAKQICQQLPIS